MQKLICLIFNEILFLLLINNYLIPISYRIQDDHDNKEMAIAITEMRQLREDLSHLRRENYQLKVCILDLIQ